MESKTLQWALVGLMVLNLGCLFFTSSGLLQQLAAVQSDLTELKAAVQQVNQKEKAAAPAAPAAKAPAKAK